MVKATCDPGLNCRVTGNAMQSVSVWQGVLLRWGTVPGAAAPLQPSCSHKERGWSHCHYRHRLWPHPLGTRQHLLPGLLAAGWPTGSVACCLWSGSSAGSWGQRVHLVRANVVAQVGTAGVPGWGLEEGMCVNLTPVSCPDLG